MVVVGLTGGIATGKTTALSFLRRLGAPVLSSDELARAVVVPGEPALAEIAAAFGSGVLQPDGTLHRQALAARVFADAAARRRLEAIVHPRIRARTLAWLEWQRARGVAAAVCDIPLLFEVGLHHRGSFVDRIWVVRVRPEEQLRRLLLRDGLTEAEARQRLAAQWPLPWKEAGADCVLDNDGPPEVLEAAVARAWRGLRAGGAAEEGCCTGGA
jgi:dephospho-CoA kinase